jgi:hypothetical protein
MAVPQKPAGNRSRRWSERQKKELMALVALCPYTQTNPPECPLCEVRKLGSADIRAWLDGLKRGDKEYLLLYHRCCLAVRSGAAGDDLAPEVIATGAQPRPVAARRRKSCPADRTANDR